MEPLSPFSQMMLDIADQHATLVRSGIRSAEQRIHPALRALKRQFETAQADSQTKMPTALEIAIVNVLALLPPEQSEPEWKDRSDLDLDIVGRPLKVGT